MQLLTITPAWYLLQAIALIAGAAGSFYVTSRERTERRIGFIGFAVGNVIWGSYSFVTGQPLLILQYLFFFGTSTLGIYRCRGTPDPLNTNPS